ncbi:FMN-binding protein [Segatella buccae]
MKTDKKKQLLMLLVCAAVMVAAAIRRDGKVAGHRLAADKQETTVRQEPDTMRKTADGTVVINTTYLAKDINGYGGNVPLEIYLKGGKVAGVKALKNSETPDFFNEAAALLTRWNGKTIEQAQAMKVDGVSGATFSSRAIIGNVRRGLQYAARNAVEPSLLDKLDLSAKTLAGLAVVLMGAIVPLFVRNKRYRLVQQVLNAAVLGFWCGTFISYSLVLGYLSGGIDLWVSLIPVVMLVTAFVYPLFGKKNYYCTHICPCGAMQELAGKVPAKRWKMSKTATARLNRFRQVLWGVLMLLMLTGLWVDWTNYEIFSAFIVGTAAVAVLAMAAVVLVLSVFVPRPYCRFVCPTGTLFKVAQGSK